MRSRRFVKSTATLALVLALSSPLFARPKSSRRMPQPRPPMLVMPVPTPVGEILVPVSGDTVMAVAGMTGGLLDPLFTTPIWPFTCPTR